MVCVNVTVASTSVVAESRYSPVEWRCCPAAAYAGLATRRDNPAPVGALPRHAPLRYGCRASRQRRRESLPPQPTIGNRSQSPEPPAVDRFVTVAASNFLVATSQLRAARDSVAAVRPRVRHLNALYPSQTARIASAPAIDPDFTIDADLGSSDKALRLSRYRPFSTNATARKRGAFA